MAGTFASAPALVKMGYGHGVHAKANQAKPKQHAGSTTNTRRATHGRTYASVPPANPWHKVPSDIRHETRQFSAGYLGAPAQIARRPPCALMTNATYAGSKRDKQFNGGAFPTYKNEASIKVTYCPPLEDERNARRPPMPRVSDDTDDTTKPMRVEKRQHQQQQSPQKVQQQQQQQQQDGLLPNGRPSAYTNMLALLATETQPRAKTAQQQKEDEEYWAAVSRPTTFVDEGFFEAQDAYWAAINEKRLAAAALRDVELALMEPLPTQASELIFGSIASLDRMLFA